MGKTSRKTKAKYKDFQKVKIKVGKTLPKGLNETRTSFQSKAIQIKEQLKKDVTQPTTNRNLTYKDLLIQSRHFSPSVRQDALHGLQELVTFHPEILAQNLGALLELTSSYSLDKEPTVRQQSIRFVKLILSVTPAVDLSPFFPIFSAHLCCAMTHIQPDIQMDSLKFLDHCLEYVPALTISRKSKILPNFIEQISGPVSRSGTEKLQVKISSFKWRLKVLERMTKFLTAIVQRRSNSGTDSMRKPQEWYEEEQDMNQSKNGMFCGVYASQPRTLCGLGFSLREMSYDDEMTDALSSSSVLFNLMTKLFPLLMQCWIEVGPSQTSANIIDVSLNSDSIPTLWSIVQIILTLIECIRQQESHVRADQLRWLKINFLKEFELRFLSHFPYVLHERAQKNRQNKKKDKTDQVKVSMQSLNLALCKLMLTLDAVDVPEPDDKTALDAESHSKLYAFIIGALRRGRLSRDQLQSIIQLLDMLPDDALRQPGKQSKDLLESMIQYYDADTTGPSTKLMLSSVFYKSSTKSQMSVNDYQTWLWSLPKLLMSLKDDGQKHELLQLMLHLASRNDSNLLEALQSSSLELIGSEVNGFISSSSEHVHISMVQLLFWLPCWTQKHAQAISHLTHQGSLSIPVVQRLLNLMLLRCRERNLAGPELSDVMLMSNMIFSIILGCSKLKLEDLSKGCLPGQQNYHLVTTAKLSLPRQALCQMALECLKQLPIAPDELSSVFCHYLLALLTSCKAMPLESALNILHILACIGWTTEGIDPPLHTITSFLSNIFTTVADSSEIEKFERVQIVKDMAVIFGRSEELWRESLDTSRKHIVENLTSQDSDLLQLTEILRFPEVKKCALSTLPELNQLCVYAEDSPGSNQQLVSDLKYEISLIR